MLLIAACAALDGGSRSAYALLLILPFLFGSFSYPLRITVLIGIVDIAAFVAIAFGVGGGLLYGGFGAFALLCAALLSSWEARNQSRRRADLAQTVQALHKSEATSSMQARQQLEVARFGQLALAGAATGRLQREASELLRRVLEVDIAGVLKLAARGRGVPDRRRRRPPRGAHRGRHGARGLRLAVGIHARNRDGRGGHRLAPGDSLRQVADGG